MKMKRVILAVLLAASLWMMTGCGAVESALRKVGQDMEASRLDTPQNNGGETDWSYVPIVREMATQTFLEGFPEATVTESGVACKNLDSRRVIVTLTYEMNGKTGSYGFDYEKNDTGEYELKRYGDGVSSDDL